MSEMTLVSMEMCQNGNTAYIGGYRQNHVNSIGGRSRCTCKGFYFHRNCKHLRAARELMCGYHEQLDGAPVKRGICPKCGGRTKTVLVGV